MNRSEAALIASRKAQQNRLVRKLAAAAALLRDAGWTVVEPQTTKEHCP